MSDSHVFETICAAADLWQELTGVDPTMSRISVGQWGDRDAHLEVAESLRLDETGLTTYMLLRGYVTAYVARQTIGVADLIKGLSSKQEARLGTMRRLLALLDDGDLLAYVDRFTTTLRQAGRHYGVTEGSLSAVVAEPLTVAALRRDAHRSYRERLEAHQFSWSPDAPVVEGAANPEVFEFWNMASLVGALEVQRHPGVTMCLVRDPSAVLHSFFAVAISNGGTVTVLTDRNKDPHPDYKHMTRRPDRSLDKRQSRNWFPYDLLDLETRDNRVVATERTGLIPVNVEGVPIARIADLPPETVLWWAMLLDLIRADYFRQNKRLEARSFTVDRLVVGQIGADVHALEAAATGALVVPKLDHSLVTAASTAAQWDVEPGGQHEWMMERYASEVPAAALNIIGPDPARAILGPGHPALALLPPPDGEVDKRPFWIVREAPGKAGLIVKDQGGARGEVALARVAVAGGLRSLDAVAFGTAADIERDRLWVARMNQAAVVNSMARAEYFETRDEILKTGYKLEPTGWFADHVSRCMGRILDIAAAGDFVAPARWLPSRLVNGKMMSGIAMSSDGQWYPEHEEVEANIVTVRLGEIPKFWSLGGFNLSIRNGDWACPVTGSRRLAYHAEIILQDWRSISMLFEVPFASLPWQIKVWRNGQDSQHGNAILDRCDPSDWRMKNPWLANGAAGAGLDLTLRVSFSRRGVNRLRKALGLPKVEWPQGD